MRKGSARVIARAWGRVIHSGTRNDIRYQSYLLTSLSSDVFKHLGNCYVKYLSSKIHRILSKTKLIFNFLSCTTCNKLCPNNRSQYLNPAWGIPVFFLRVPPFGHSTTNCYQEEETLLPHHTMVVPLWSHSSLRSIVIFDDLRTKVYNQNAIFFWNVQSSTAHKHLHK